MKIKCCGQSKKQKGESTLTELKDVAQKLGVRKSAVVSLDVVINDLRGMEETDLKSFLNTLQKCMSAVTTELVRRTGTKTCSGSITTDSNRSKPITVNVPGVGDCQYTGD